MHRDLEHTKEMRVKYKIMLSAAMAAALLAAGCAPLPVLDVEHEHVERYDDKTMTLNDMEKVVRIAAYKEEWETDTVSPGHIVATKRSGNDWKLVVDILYTATDFSIHYKDSSGLQYNPMTGKIAKHGRGVMNDLESRIRDEVQDISVSN